MEKEIALFNGLFNLRYGANSLGNGRVPEGSNPETMATAPMNCRLCAPIKQRLPLSYVRYEGHSSL